MVDPAKKEEAKTIILSLVNGVSKTCYTQLGCPEYRGEKWSLNVHERFAKEIENHYSQFIK